MIAVVPFSLCVSCPGRCSVLCVFIGVSLVCHFIVASAHFLGLLFWWSYYYHFCPQTNKRRCPDINRMSLRKAVD